MAINIIKNKYYDYGYGNTGNRAWYEHNITIEHLSPSAMNISCDTEYVVTEDLPPGIYQVFDFTQYDNNVSLDIQFSALAMNEGESYKLGVHIFKLESHTTDPVSARPVFELVGNYRESCIFSSWDWIADYDYSNTKINSVVLEPGAYAFGITANTYRYVPLDGSYEKFNSEKILQTRLIDIAVYLTELHEVDFQNILVNGHFESINAPFDKWFFNGIEAMDFENDTNFHAPVNFGSYNKKIKFLSKDEVSVADTEDKQYGLNQVITLDYNCNAIVDFWGRYDVEKTPPSPSPLYSTYFRIIVYKLSYYSDDDNSYSVDEISFNDSYYVYPGDALQNQSSWQYFKSDILTLEAGTYLLSIVPPGNTQGNDIYAYVDNVNFNIYSINLNKSGDGRFESPYTRRDGFFFYDHFHPSNSNCSMDCYFMFYDGTFPARGSHIYVDGKYYLISNENNGQIYFGKEAIYATEVGQRYIYADGHMAINEAVTWDDYNYIANYCGELELNGLKVVKIEAWKIIDSIDEVGLVESVDFFPDDTYTFRAKFNEQNPPITLTVTCSNYSVVRIIEINPGTSSYNNSNDITIEAVSYGEAVVTISYQNADGTVPSYSFPVRVRNEFEYENPDAINLVMTTAENYVALGDHLALKCLVLPALSSQIPIDWYSSDRNIAKVDSYGNITPVALGTCTITAINFNTNKSAFCKLNVVEKTVAPASISTSTETVTIGLAESVRITASAYSVNGNTRYVKQEFVWAVLDSSIATVDQFGFVNGVKKGTTTIICTHADNNEVSKRIKVNVTGTLTALTDIELNLYEFYINIGDKVGGEYLIPKFIPSDTNETSVIWTISHPDIVGINKNGWVYIKTEFNSSTGLYPTNGVNKVTIKCTSATNPSISRTCTVKLVPSAGYYPSIQLGVERVKTIVGNTIRISCETSRYYNSLIPCTVEVTRKDGSSTTNTASFNTVTEEIKFIANEAGEFTLAVSCDFKGNVTTKTCEVTVYDSDAPPVFLKQLEVLYGLQNGTGILRYYAEDAMDDVLGCSVTIDNADYFDFKTISTVYNGQNYYYLFIENIPAGDHNIYITVNDQSTIIGSSSFTQSNQVMLTIPTVVNKKAGLNDAKQLYDIVKNEVIDYMTTVVQDKKVYANEKEEFTCRYEVFCYHYYNLENILEVCVDYINSQIAAEQASMSTIATALASDGASVATYSEGDYTNSNYENISDMDYYQNECIKQLVARILQLEARLDELTNN